MPQDFRAFAVNDPFGRTWKVEFRWHQNAISIRHADAIDVKYYINDGMEFREIVLSLGHPALVKLAQERQREVSDAWIIRLAGLHLQHMLSTWTDMEQTLVDIPPQDLARHNRYLEETAAQEHQRALLSH